MSEGIESWPELGTRMTPLAWARSWSLSSSCKDADLFKEKMKTHWFFAQHIYVGSPVRSTWCTPASTHALSASAKQDLEIHGD
jgi:hypothetical protein